MKKITLRHIVTKSLKIQDKVQIIKADRKRYPVYNVKVVDSWKGHNHPGYGEHFKADSKNTK